MDGDKVFVMDDKVVGLLESKARHSNIMTTLVEKEGLYGKTLYAKPINHKLPWFEIEKPPKEYVKDCDFNLSSESRNPSHRYYIIKYKDWRTNRKTPLGEVVECVGEAGNLKVEVMRLLKMWDVCTEEYNESSLKAL